MGGEAPDWNLFGIITGKVSFVFRYIAKTLLLCYNVLKRRIRRERSRSMKHGVLSIVYGVVTLLSMLLFLGYCLFDKKKNRTQKTHGFFTSYQPKPCIINVALFL